MDYEGQICRSPFERGSFMLPVMVGCSHNACKFCGLFRHVDYRILPIEQVEDELKRVSAAGGNPSRVFLGDGNAFTLSTGELLTICDLINSYLPSVEQINMDATVTSILDKSDVELKSLHDAGVRHLYLGIECALDDVLEFMNKDHDMDEAKRAINALFDAGLIFDAHIMSGICGEGRGQVNAHALAKFFSEYPPQNICNFDMNLGSKTPLWNDYVKGTFRPSDCIEKFNEVKTFLSEVKLELGRDMFYDAVFEHPPVRLMGNIATDRDKMMSQLDTFIEKYKNSEKIYSIWDANN